MRKGIYKDNKGRWYIHTTISGKTCTIRGFYSKKNADDNYDEPIEKWKREHIADKTTGEYETVLNDYYSFRERQIAKQSVDKIRTHFRTYWNAIFKGQLLTSVFNTKRLAIIYDNISNNVSLNERKKYNVVRCFLDFANYCYLTKHISEELYKEVKVIFQPFKDVKQVENNKRYIPQTHLNALVSAVDKADDKIFSLAIFVLYFGGLRISELLGLTYQDIDLDDKKIKVQRQLLTTGEITATLKTKNSYRSVPISSKLLNKLEQIAHNRLNNLVISSKSLEQMRVFDYSHTTFKRKLKQYEEQANIPLYSCHEFRHTFCTNLASKCTNISEAVYCSKIAGHTASLFLNTYCKSLDDELEDKFFR